MFGPVKKVILDEKMTPTICELLKIKIIRASETLQLSDFFLLKKII